MVGARPEGRARRRGSRRAGAQRAARRAVFRRGSVSLKLHLSSRHPGLDPGSRFFAASKSGMPDQVRHDEWWTSGWKRKRAAPADPPFPLYRRATRLHLLGIIERRMFVQALEK